MSIFPWADFRTTKGAIKLHVGLNHAGYLPEFVTVTEGSTHEVNIGKLMNFPKGSIVVIDRGYNDYGWYKGLTDKGIFFVTRLKKNAGYRVVKRQKVNKKQGLTCDQSIEFTGSITAKKCPIRLRRVGYRDPETGKHYVFLTNNFKLSARTIADIYKSRWQVELFFKWIKQNLKIKSFIGTSKNAVLTQVWIALFAGGATSAAQQVHLLGFVEYLCPGEPHCFELRVKPEFIEATGARIIVRFDHSTLVFDPENYELTLKQSNIVDGSHLRLLLTSESDLGENHYRASVIWIGD